MRRSHQGLGVAVPSRLEEPHGAPPRHQLMPDRRPDFFRRRGPRALMSSMGPQSAESAGQCT